MKNNSLMVGVFVVISVVLGVAAVLVLGAKDVLTEKKTYVMYFEGNMNGLGPGAPVVFKGVKIGEVVDISIILDSDLNASVPVFVELDSTNITSAAPSEPESNKHMSAFLKRGLCAKLAIESFVTGKLLIQMDFEPKKEIPLHGHKGREIEIPTVTSDLEQLKETLAGVPLKSMMTSLVGSLEGIDKRVNSIEVTDSLKALSASLQNLEKLLKHGDQQIVSLGARSDKALDQAQNLMVTLDVSVKGLTKTLNGTMGEIKALTSNMNSQVGTMGVEVKQVTSSATKTLQELEHTLAQYSMIMDVDSPVYIGMLDAVNNFSKALNSITAFTEYLNRHPESLLSGKKGN